MKIKANIIERQTALQATNDSTVRTGRDKAQKRDDASGHLRAFSDTVELGYAKTRMLEEEERRQRIERLKSLYLEGKLTSDRYDSKAVAAKLDEVVSEEVAMAKLFNEE